MKNLILLAFLLPMALWAQKNNASAPQKPAGDITLVCKIFGLTTNLDSMFVYENIGTGNRVVARVSRASSDSAYVLKVPASAPRFYLVGNSEATAATVILGDEKVVTLWGSIKHVEKSRTMNSPANFSYEKILPQIASMQEEDGRLRAQYKMAHGGAQPPASADLKRFGKTKMKFLDSLKTANPLLWRYASLQLTPDYTGQGTESDFYTKEYFHNVDLTDKAFEFIPEVYKAFEAYTVQLISLGNPHDKVVAATEAVLAKIPAGSLTYRMALGGIVSALKNAKSGQFSAMAKKYLDLYANSSYGEIAKLKMEIRIADAQASGASIPTTPGAEVPKTDGAESQDVELMFAPDMTGMTPDSTTFSLKQLRGKVVLIDFWASWCGPCRRENPNVVANYQKYKDKGFDIFGVSLDRDMPSWRKAIAADGLTWHHISDLKGWQSSFAALYSISSIPQSVLIDKEGKIIARNLRGEQLAAKLQEIFGM